MRRQHQLTACQVVRCSDLINPSDVTGTLTANQRLGTGSGLDRSAADEIVRRHHGTMAVHANIWHAPSFRVTLPTVQPVFRDSTLPLEI